MKLFGKLFKKGKNLSKTNASVEQQGENPISVIGNVKDSLIGCPIYINEIEPQWQDRLKAYTATLQQFKPLTALSLLEKLEESFITSSKKPSPEFCSLISFQKGMCYRFLDDRKKMCECFITAYNENASVLQFEEQAVLSYFKIEDKPKTIELVDKILSKNEYNPIAWYIKFLSSTDYDFNSIPTFVKQNILFQQMLYNYFNQKNLYDCILQMKVFSMLPVSKDYKPIDVTINNFEENIFYSNVFFSDYLHNHAFTFHCFNDGNIEILKTLEELLRNLTSAIRGSDIEKKYGTLFFLYAYVQFVFTKDIKYLSEMRDHYLKLEKKNDILALLCSNTLQINNQTDFALDILNDPELKQSNIFYLKAYCFLKKNDKILYGKAIKEWINSIEEIDNTDIDSYLASIFTLKGIGETDDLKLSDFILNIKFENEQLKTMVETIVNVLIKKEIDVQELSVLSDLVSNIEQPKLLLYFADTYYYCERFELANNLYEKYADKETENQHLFNYIHSLNTSNKNSDELLYLLQKWRLKYSFQPDLYRIEADLCSILHDWKRCLEVCNSFLIKSPENEVVSTLKLRCLDNINEDWCEVEIKSLSQFFSKYTFSISQNIPLIANILINHGNYEEGLEILYKNKEKNEVRSAYIFATLTYTQKNEDKNFLKEYEEVIDGCWVKYEINNETHFYEMSNNSDNLYKKLLGHKVGDIISFNGQLVNKDYSISVLRIMDKYLYFHDEIIEEAKQPPIISGLPLESFSFSSTEPQNMVQELISLFGRNGEEEKKRKETALKNYYDRTLSFSELIIQIYTNDYLGGYSNLVHEQSGIVALPLSIYQTLPQPPQGTSFVIDFSSLIILHKITKEYNIAYPNKFLISTFIVDLIKQKLRAIKNELKSEMSVDFSTDGVTKYQLPENMQQTNIAYLESLIKWIEVNCESVVSTKIIEFKRNITLEHEQDSFIDYILNTILIREDEQALLLTDDLVYAKFNMLPLQFSISSEKYVKDVLGDDHPALFEFIKSRYKGFSLSTNQLLDEFNKKMNSQDNYYANCLESISMASVIPCIKLVNAIIQSKLDTSLQEIEIKNVFVNMLKSGPLSNEIIQNFEMLIYLELNYSQEKLNFVGQCLEDVYQILGITDNITKSE